MIVSHNNENFSLNIKPIDKEYYEITINKEKYFIKTENFYSSDKYINTYFIFKKNNELYKAIITEDKNHYYVTINGKNFILQKSSHVEESYTTNIEINITEIIAPLPGTISKIFVQEKQEIKKDDILLIIESMKMENQIRSPRNSIIDKIYVSEGQKVETNQILIKIL
jgi:biotin carboxyl carrier protein